MIIYAFGIPVLDQLSTVVVQWLENIKGKLMVEAQRLQNEITKLADEVEESTDQVTNVIGFQIPDVIDYDEEDYDEDDDE